MPAYYSLVQYVPDLVRRERVNIGIVVFNEERMKSHFIENWNRIRQFGGCVPALQDVAKQIEQMSLEVLRNTIESWQHSIQFTAPAASLLDLDSLLIDMTQRCLIDPEQQERSYRNRQQAVAITKNSLANALREVIGKAAVKLLKAHFAMSGSLDRHEYDIALVNGQPLLAANSLSFETPDRKEIVKVSHATAWSIEDIKRRDSSFRLAIIALPPKQPSEVYDRAVNTFKSLGAEIVVEDELEAWSFQVATQVRDKLLLPRH